MKNMVSKMTFHRNNVIGLGNVGRGLLRVLANPTGKPSSADNVWFSVPSYSLGKEIRKISPELKANSNIFTVCPKTTVKNIRHYLDRDDIGIGRVMPSTISMLGMSVFPVYTDNNETFKACIESLVGERVLRMKDESQLESMTLINGSSPAYISWLINLIVEKGVRQGLDRESVMQCLTMNMFGVTRKLIDGYTTEEIIERVRTPGGVTSTGLKNLKRLEPVIDAILSGTKK